MRKYLEYVNTILDAVESRYEIMDITINPRKIWIDIIEIDDYDKEIICILEELSFVDSCSFMGNIIVIRLES